MALELAFYLLIRKSILIYPIVSGFFVGCFPVAWRLSVGCFWVFLGLVLVSLGWFWIACGLLVCCFWVACQFFVNCFLDACTENPFPDLNESRISLRPHSQKENHVFITGSFHYMFPLFYSVQYIN